MSSRNNSKNWLAILLILLGSLLLVNQLNFLPFNVFEFFWPAIFALIGIKGLVDNPGSNTIFKSGLVFFAALLVLRNFEIVSFGWEIVWPIILIGLGVAFLFDNNFFNQTKKTFTDSGGFDIFTMFSSNERKLNLEPFRGGSITTVFGGAEVDLTSSQLEENATIDLTVAFGGVSLIVPASWTVDIEVLPVFGGCEDARSHSDKTTDKKLKITGTVAFGGLEVTDKSKHIKYN